MITEQQALAIALTAESAGAQCALALGVDMADLQIKVYYRRQPDPTYIEVMFASSAERAAPAESGEPELPDQDEASLVPGEDFFIRPHVVPGAGPIEDVTQ
jgi:hypothetical protein